MKQVGENEGTVNEVKKKKTNELWNKKAMKAN